MKTFLFTTLPTNDLGLLTRSLPIARELKTRGYKIVFSNPAKAPKQLIADAGFENREPKHPVYELIDIDQSLKGFGRLVIGRPWKRYGLGPIRFFKKLFAALPTKVPPITSVIWNMDHAGAMMGLLNEGFVRANCEAYRNLIESSDADVVVDFWNPFAVIAARACKKPVITVIQSNAHPDSGGFIWWEPTPKNIPTPAAAINRVLLDYGLPPVGKLADLSVGDMTLVVGMPETDPLPDQRSVTYVGTVLWQKQGTALPASISKLPANKPLIWVYSGNPRYASTDGVLDSMVVLQACKEALASLDVSVVLTTGHHRLPEELLPLPANFRHEAYLPGLLMAERCDLLIHHGGYGSCQTGLHAGKPAVIIPTYSERLSNARRMEAAGAAQIVTVRYAGRDKCVQPEELRASVERVLGNRQFADNARRLGEKLRSFCGASGAARLIENFALSAPSSVAPTEPCDASAKSDIARP